MPRRRPKPVQSFRRSLLFVIFVSPSRTHQAQIATIVSSVGSGQADEFTDILAVVTPGGGKSLLLVIAAFALLLAGIIDWVSCGSAAGSPIMLTCSKTAALWLDSPAAQRMKAAGRHRRWQIPFGICHCSYARTTRSQLAGRDDTSEAIQ